MQQITQRILILWLASCLGLAVKAAEWRQEVVDPSGGSKYSSLRIDTSGNAHVSYVDDVQHLLKYGFWDRHLNKWFTATLDSSTGFCSLTLDSLRHPHISYLDFGGGKLKYAYWNGSAWVKQVIQINAKVIDYYTSIALDSKGNPSISFYEYWGSGQDYLLHLRNAWWNGKFWQVTTVDSTPGSGKFNASAAGSKGNPHIAYANVKSENASLRYARWNGQAWESEVLEGMGVSGYSAFSVAIALDRMDTPHITYADVTNRQVKYATRRNGIWQIQVVDSLAEVAYPDRNGIALDDQGHPYISYYDAGRGLLKLAHQKNDKWVAEIVDQNAAGFTSSLQIDRGTIWVTYADESGQLLKCARQQLEQTVAADQRSASSPDVAGREK